ncbi:MAG: molybdopterin molybdotransferase MoeA [archaeon GB-1867-005]|nr:molybdopterin molybdotransferase MoeA [Candidatus Culexmicrobium cathedralense]
MIAGKVLGLTILGRGFKKLIKVEEAIRRVEKELTYRINEVEVVDLISSLGRISAETIVAPIDVPPYDRAAMDGYAAGAEDITGATQLNPAILKLIGSIEVGELKDIKVNRGEAVEISTGAKIPEGANVVVPYEDARKVDGYVEVYRAIPLWKNISKRGEDIKAGELVLAKGTTIKAWDIGVLASLNITKVKVLRRPRIAVLSTGNELIELGEELKLGKIVNSTKWMIASLIKEVGGEFIDLGTSEDEVKEISNRILNGLKLADIVITTGGTSVGKKDFVIKAVEAIGAKIVFHGVSMRPGKPTGFAILNGKPIIMLSGFPVAALIGFELFAKKAISLISGWKEIPKQKIKAKMARRVASELGFRDFLRVKLKRVESEILAEPLKLTGSGILSTITKSSGMIIIPEEVEGIEEGEEVEVILLRPLEDI